MEKKYFTQNPKTKTVTVDLSVKQPTAADEKMVEMLLKAGYVLRMKKEANENTKITSADITEALKNDKEAITTYEKKKKEHGFFGARKWYIENYLNKEDSKKDKEIDKKENSKEDKKENTK